MMWRLTSFERTLTWPRNCWRHRAAIRLESQAWQIQREHFEWVKGLGIACAVQ
jgi:hypothetical protein